MSAEHVALAKSGAVEDLVQGERELLARIRADLSGRVLVVFDEIYFTNT